MISIRLMEVNNRSRNRMKLMNWERCGFVVYHKQMEKGCSVLKTYEQVLYFMNFDGILTYQMWIV